jgi:hypothetical protein
MQAIFLQKKGIEYRLVIVSRSWCYCVYGSYPFGISEFLVFFFKELLSAIISKGFISNFRKVHAQLLQNQPIDPYLKTTLQQFTLQGDPAIRLFKAIALPDMAFVKNSLSVDFQQDSLKVIFR